jgi:hypothetical protein
VIRFSSQILPPYLRRTKSLAELLPWLYLRGISTGDFSSVLTSLLGQDAPGLSAATIQRLKESWKVSRVTQISPIMVIENSPPWLRRR